MKTLRRAALPLLCLSLWGCGDSRSHTKQDGKSAANAAQSACLATLPPRVNIPAGTGMMGSNKALPEEAPMREITVQGFDMDATEVTNGQFAEFVAATRYVTDAEKDQPGFDKPGAAVFRAISPSNPRGWDFVEGAHWRAPEGPGSSIKGREMDPVVQVSYNDAQSYAKWAGRALPTEAQWEYAARAGADTRFIWGEEKSPDGQELANTWQGIFPVQDTGGDGYKGRAPVGCYEPNAFGLYDIIGNTWEWTGSVIPGSESQAEAVYVIKGGSFLCAENYCRRYRASARQFQEAGFPTNHIGFRTVSVQ